MEKLLGKCQSIGIAVRTENGQIIPEDNHIVSFLQILDRREYDFDLTEDEPEIYVASSRKKIR